MNKQGLLLEVVQILTDMNLTICKSYISSDAGWFMDGMYHACMNVLPFACSFPLIIPPSNFL